MQSNSRDNDENLVHRHKLEKEQLKYVREQRKLLEMENAKAQTITRHSESQHSHKSASSQRSHSKNKSRHHKSHKNSHRKSRSRSSSRHRHRKHRKASSSPSSPSSSSDSNSDSDDSDSSSTSSDNSHSSHRKRYKKKLSKKHHRRKSNSVSTTSTNNTLRDPTAEAMRLMAENVKGIQNMNLNATMATALQNLRTLTGQESYMAIKNYFDTIEDYTIGWNDYDKVELLKKRVSHRAKKVMKEAKSKYGRDFRKIKAKLMKKLALTDTHKSNCREALRRGLHKKETENLKQFGSRIYEVCLGAYPDDKNIEETAIDHFLYSLRILF